VKPWYESLHFLVGILDSWVWRQSCTHRPLEWIAALYDKRREMKRADDPAEYALKLILNSCYGKFAQHVGQAPYRCVEWAGLITARTRARLGEVLVQQPEDVLLVATDGYVTTRKRELGAALVLGAWENAGTFDWADVWQPGFYFLSDGLLRTRGFTKADVDVQAFRDEWGERGVLGKVKVHRERVTGYRLATAQHRMQDLCTWKTDEAEVSFWPLPRRDFDGMEFPTLRTAAPLSWQAEQRRGGKREDGAAVQETRQLWDYLEDGEPQGYVRD
jgi:DNA polymerase elongation subunit (family B)